MRVREGDFVETSDRLLFDVKGLIHPPDRVVAYLRYYPDKRGTRTRNGVRYAKVYDLTKRQSLLEKRWPIYLHYDEVQGRELQSIPEKSIHALYAPQRRFAALVRLGRKDVLEESATRLVEALAEESGLPSKHFGISGSLLVGLHQEGSDLDIIVYGTIAAKRVKQALTTLLKTDRHFHVYGARDLTKLFTKRGMRKAITFRDFTLQERRKVFQGRFLRHDYFVRCVKDWDEITGRYGDTRYEPAGECTVVAQVADDSEGLLTPCRYLLEHVEVLAGDHSRIPREVTSFRGRFAEQAVQGDRVFARGRLERVRSKESEYFRLVIGEVPTDVLRTLW